MAVLVDLCGIPCHVQRWKRNGLSHPLLPSLQLCTQQRRSVVHFAHHRHHPFHYPLRMVGRPVDNQHGAPQRWNLGTRTQAPAPSPIDHLGSSRNFDDGSWSLVPSSLDRVHHWMGDRHGYGTHWSIDSSQLPIRLFSFDQTVKKEWFALPGRANWCSVYNCHVDSIQSDHLWSRECLGRPLSCPLFQFKELTLSFAPQNYGMTPWFTKTPLWLWAVSAIIIVVGLQIAAVILWVYGKSLRKSQKATYLRIIDL